MDNNEEAWTLDFKVPAKITRANIDYVVQHLSLNTSLEIKGNTAILRAQHDSGTLQYFAKGGEEIFWLKQKSFKSEIKGCFTIFHIRLEE